MTYVAILQLRSVAGIRCVFNNRKVGASSIIRKEGLELRTLIYLVNLGMMVAITGEQEISYLGLLTTEITGPSAGPRFC